MLSLPSRSAAAPSGHSAAGQQTLQKPLANLGETRKAPVHIGQRLNDTSRNAVEERLVHVGLSFARQGDSAAPVLRMG